MKFLPIPDSGQSLCWSPHAVLPVAPDNTAAPQGRNCCAVASGVRRIDSDLTIGGDIGGGDTVND